MPDEDIWSWSTTAAANGTADTGISWPEGQARATVNNSARAMMAAHAKDRDLRSGSITAGGTVNALTFASGLNYLATPLGLTARIKIPGTLLNTGPCTLNMDSIGGVAIINNSGTTLGGGELIGYQDFRWDGTYWALLNFAGTTFTTGDVKFTLKTVADPGWLLMDDTTIGSMTSGAAHVADNMQQLFNLLFANITDEWAPIKTSTGIDTTRGTQGTAASAWAVNCRMTLPKTLGRALASAGSGEGLTARLLGSTVGAETETPTVAKMAAHSHSFNFLDSASPPIFTVVTGAGADFKPVLGSTGSQGGGTPLNILDPSVFLNVMIKL